MTGIGPILYQVLRLYGILIIVYVLMSWFPTRGFVADVQQVLGSVVEPYLSIFRRLIPPISNVDLSPIIAYFLLMLVASFVRTL